MNTKEKSLWGWFSKNFGKVSDFDWQRVENGCGSGTPDVEICFRSVTSWIELKVAEPRKTRGMWFVRFRPLQVPWLKRRWAKGGRAFVLIRAGDQHYLIPGNRAELVSGSVDENTLFKLSIVHPDAMPYQILEACNRAF